MKIVFLADSVYAHLSGRPCLFCGAERQQLLLARALSAAGWIVIFGVQQGLPAGKREKIGTLEFVGIGEGAALAAWSRFLFAERPDWWYWRGAYHLLGPAVEIAKLARVRTIVACAFDSDVAPRKALTIRRRWWPLYAWALNRTDRIFVQHQAQFGALAKRWRTKAAIVSSIAGDSMLPMKPHAERDRYVAWVGMLRQPKRPDLLVEIARQSPGIRFVVCGAPSNHRSPMGYGGRIEQTLKTTANVEFLGYVAPDKANDVIAGASLLLSTAAEEGFPNTFLQAWSSGTPVVSLGIDPDGVMGNGGFGVVVNDCASAAARIAGLLDDDEVRQTMGVVARQHVSSVHSASAVTALFERSVSSPNAGPILLETVDRKHVSL